MTTKETIRKRLLKRRKSLDDLTVKNLSHFAQEAILSSNAYKNSLKIAVYYATHNEVSTNLIIETALRENKSLYFPHWYPEHALIRFFHVEDISQLELKPWGIREPRPDLCPENVRFDFDLILVPGIAFDRHGYRLGYGVGGYDRILSGIAIRAWGLAYDFQVLDSLPVDPHDVPLSEIVTEKGTILNK